MTVSKNNPGSGRAKERLAKFFELPMDSIIEVPRIVVIGNTELSIENHLGIIGFTSESVVIATAKGHVTVKGKGLSISGITKTIVGVQGRIEHLDLPCDSR